MAAAETEHPIDGDSWFWTDDNAKIVEFLSRPELWQRFPDQVTELLRFLRGMCRGPFIFRRAALPRLDVSEPKDGFARWRHSLLTIGADLARGIVSVSPRFHDDRGAEIWLTGNRVEFTWRGRRHHVAVEPAIDNTAAVAEAGRLTLRHTGTVTVDGAQIGRVAYIYTFDAGTLAFTTEAAFEIESGIEVADVVMTIGHMHLPAYRDAVISDDSGVPLFTTALPTRRRVAVAGSGYYQLRQGRISGDAPALHSRAREPGRLAGIDVVVRRPWVPHRVAARHGFPGRHRSGRLVAAETKMLTAGGLYRRADDYIGFLTDAAENRIGAVLDYSIAYDYGSIINGFAKSFAVCAAGAAPVVTTLGEELRTLCDFYFDTYFREYVDEHEGRPDAIFSRELAFVTLAAVTMHRATADAAYLHRLRRLCDVLLDFELPLDGRPASAFLMRRHSPEAGPADCHSAVLLALTRAAPLVEDARVPAAIERGLAAYHRRRFDGYQGSPHRFEAIATAMAYNYRRHRVPLLSYLAARRYRRTAQPDGADPIVWSYKVGLTLRLFAALRQTDDPALKPIAMRHRAELAGFETELRAALAEMTTWHDDGTLEIRALPLAPETNSESQPWAMLGLLGHPFD